MRYCNHKDKTDLSQGIGDDRHFFCPSCGAHWYNGRFWTKREWSLYIESATREIQEGEARQ